MVMGKIPDMYRQTDETRSKIVGLLHHLQCLKSFTFPIAVFGMIVIETQ